MNYILLLFGFRGRINRARYVVVQLALLTFWLILWPKVPVYLSSLSILVVTIPMIWINAAITIKRLHDRNWNGWWAVPIFTLNRLAYAYCGLFFGLYFGVDISAAKELLLVMIAVTMSLLGTWIFIELFFLIGTEGPNRFGPDPLAHVAPNPSVESRPEPYSVPDFLVRRAGPPTGQLR